MDTDPSRRADMAWVADRDAMTELLLREIDGERYAAWFEANRPELHGRGPFHDPAWLQSAARGVGFDLGFIGGFEGKELASVVPGFLARRGPFRLFGSPLRGTMTSYLGPVSLGRRIGSDGWTELARSCTDFARRTWRARYARFTVRDAPLEDAAPPGTDWHVERPGSYRLDLSQGEDALFESVKPSCRRNVRRAFREGVQIVPLEDPALFYRILEETFRRHGSTSWHPRAFFETLMRELPTRGLLWSWGARYQDEIISVGLFFHDDREMHFIAGASLPQHGSLPTSYPLHWHAITVAVNEGLEVYNSDPAEIPSIDRFKETFAPVRQQRGTLIWAPSSVWTAQRWYRTLNDGTRRLRSRVRAA